MLETALGVEGLTLNHLMAKTSLFVQINHFTDSSFTHKPVGYASGFFFKYHEDFFFITADHVPHYEDYKNRKRTGNGDLIAVHTNKVDNKLLASQLYLFNLTCSRPPLINLKADINLKYSSTAMRFADFFCSSKLVGL